MAAPLKQPVPKAAKPAKSRPAKAPSKTLRVFADNMERLIQADKQFNSQPRLAQKAEVDQKTIWRISKLRHEPTLALVEKIAAVFGLAAWQMLMPGLQPGQRPELKHEVVVLEEE